MQELETYVHHTSEYLQVANANGFELVELKDWFYEDSENGISRLISFMFKN